jgi:hypothetical protein
MFLNHGQGLHNLQESDSAVNKDQKDKLVRIYDANWVRTIGCVQLLVVMALLVLEIFVKICARSFHIFALKILRTGYVLQ